MSPRVFSSFPLFLFLDECNKNRQTLDPVQFSKGDRVLVIEGDLYNLVGVVTDVQRDAVNGDTVTMLPDDKELTVSALCFVLSRTLVDVFVLFCFQDSYQFPAKQLAKYFSPSDHVKIIGGRYTGETGLVVRIEGATAMVVSDSNLKVRIIRKKVKGRKKE